MIVQVTALKLLRKMIGNYRAHWHLVRRTITPYAHSPGLRPEVLSARIQILHNVSPRQTLLLNDAKFAYWAAKSACIKSTTSILQCLPRQTHTGIDPPSLKISMNIIYDTSDRRHCIIMSRILRTPLQEAWPNMPDKSRSSIVVLISTPTAKRRKFSKILFGSHTLHLNSAISLPLACATF